MEALKTDRKEAQCLELIFRPRAVSGSKLIVIIEVGGEEKEICVDRFFRERGVNPNYRNYKALYASLPDTMAVEEKIDQCGYFIFPKTELEKWLMRFREIDTKRRRKE